MGFYLLLVVSESFELEFENLWNVRNKRRGRETERER